MVITLIFAILGGALAGGVIAAVLSERSYRQSLDEETASAFKRGIELGERNARFHNRSFIRYEKYERLTPEQVMPGPFVEETNR
jgi:hypothetical protein